jgi:cell division protein FtsZ
MVPVAVPVQEPVFASEPGHSVEPARVSEPVSVPEPQHFDEPVAVAVAEPAAHADIFGQANEEETGENLDIPAFMRRGGL